VDDLKECLESISGQTRVPNEVIVVDNSDRDKEEVRKSVERLAGGFGDKGIQLRYFRNEIENSLTVAKNLGISHATGEIISFLDDDVVLSETYYQEVIGFYENHPDALGVEGKVLESNGRGFRYVFAEILGRLFYLGYRERDKCRMLPSLGVTYLLEDKIVNCEWISGASAYRREVFDEFTYDENLKKYSWGEDSDLSYRVFRRYPNSLYVAPQVRYMHKVSASGRTSKKEIVFMEEIYYLYLFYKIIDQSFKNKMIYLWSRVGRLVFRIVSLLTLKSGLKDLIYSFAAFAICIRHLREIKSGDLAFFNDTL
jgi:GT2 family glycosyltransferase